MHEKAGSQCKWVSLRSETAQVCPRIVGAGVAAVCEGQAERPKCDAYTILVRPWLQVDPTPPPRRVTNDPLPPPLGSASGGVFLAPSTAKNVLAVGASQNAVASWYELDQGDYVLRFRSEVRLWCLFLSPPWH